MAEPRQRIPQKSVKLMTIEGEKTFRYSVSVNSLGLFTTTLPEELVKILEDADVRMLCNRLGRSGYFESDTLRGLTNRISDAVALFNTMEVISKETILQYVIQTRCSYQVLKGDIIPNGMGRADGKNEWIHGTTQSSATYPSPFGILVYVSPKVRIIKKRHDGYMITTYENVSPTTGDLSDPLTWLSRLTTMDSPSGEPVNEIVYTEELGRFFVTLVKSICRFNENFKDMFTPEKIEQLAQRKGDQALLL